MTGAPVGVQSVWAVVSCMDRLLHLLRTLPRLLDLGLHVVLVDYGCPNHCGTWARDAFAQHCDDQRLVVVREDFVREFHKTRAHNLGARVAMLYGAQALCFLDADTLVYPGFEAFCALARPGCFSIVRPSHWGRDLTGVLLLTTADFRSSGGFNEEFRGYGAEDLEMRLRLRLRCGLDFDFFPDDTVSAITHGDELRTRHYRHKDARRSHYRNLKLLDRLVRRWTGSGILTLRDSSLQPLLTVTSRAEAFRSTVRKPQRLR
jgi:hypothetical protein